MASLQHILWQLTNSPHIAIDPFQSYYDDLALSNIKKLGFDNLLTFHRDYSHNVLPKKVLEGEKFEFVFIDGDHKFDGILVDFYYSDLLLEPNGYVLFHDTWMRSTQLVAQFIRKNRKDYQRIKTPLRNFDLYQKIDKDQRDGMFFSEFYTSRRILVHGLIRWMTTGKTNALKRLIHKLKNSIK